MGRIRPWKYLRTRPFQLPQIITSGQELEGATANRQQDKLMRDRAMYAKQMPSDYAAQTSAARLARAKEAGEPHFKLGHKQVWLPDLSITFIRTPELHPRFAKFLVPLHIGKLDFRDFLWHGYQTRALNLRSWVYQRPVEIQESRAIGKARARWHRKKALKYMIVEMDEPFVWPEMPKDMSAYDKQLFNRMRDKTVNKDGNRAREDWFTGTDFLKNTRQKLRNDAASLLSGEMRWRPTSQVYERQKYM